MNRQRITALERRLDAARYDNHNAAVETIIYIPWDHRNPAERGRHGSVYLYDPDATEVESLIAGQDADPG